MRGCFLQKVKSCCDKTVICIVLAIKISEMYCQFSGGFKHNFQMVAKLRDKKHRINLRQCRLVCASVSLKIYVENLSGDGHYHPFGISLTH